MSTKAAKSTSFYSAFSSLLSSTEASIAAAKSTQDFDRALAALIDARSTLKDKDLEGSLSNRDKEQYERRLKALQDSLTQKRSASSSFSFRRPTKLSTSESHHKSNNSSSSSSSSIDPYPATMSASTPAPQISSADVQVTLQSQRLVTFQDLSHAASTNDQAEGLSLSLSHLSDCIIDFRKAPKTVLALHATNLKGCALLLPEVQGSVLLSGLEGSVVSVKSCGQFRIYGSKRTSILVNSSSAVTLEACASLIISSLGQDELDVDSDQSVSSIKDVEVQDFDAPSSGAGTAGTTSWIKPCVSDRANLLARLRILLEKGLSQTSSADAWLQDLAELQGPPVLFRKEDAGILLVYSDPGEEATVDEFNDWYDNEHVPLRTLAFTEFRSAARYRVDYSSHASSDSPVWKAGWSALYTISDNAMYADPKYSNLRSNRSPREGALVVRLGVLDRRIYTLKVDNLSDQPKGDLRARTQLDVERESRSIVHFGFNVDKAEAEVIKWFKDTILPAFKSITAVSRIRLFSMCGDAVVNGKWALEGNASAKEEGLWSVLIEFTTDSVPTDAGYQDALRSSQLTSIAKDLEERRMSLYRAWDATKALEEDSKF